MEIGQKILTVSRPPYTLFSQESEIKVVEITVVSSHEVKSEYSDTVGTGYIGKGDDGYTYAYNYPSLSDSFNVEWHKYFSDKDANNLSDSELNFVASHYLAYDMTQFYAPRKAKFAEKYNVEFCDRHKRHHYSKCAFCSIEASSGKTINLDNTGAQEVGDFKGWY